jgi:hypothetical protein
VFGLASTVPPCGSRPGRLLDRGPGGLAAIRDWRILKEIARDKDFSSRAALRMGERAPEVKLIAVHLIAAGLGDGGERV